MLRLPSGTLVYGLPMSGAFGTREAEAHLVWCAPARDHAKKLVAYCFVKSPHSSVIRSRYPFSVSYLTSPPAVVVPVDVEPGPISFPQPLRLEIRVSRIRREYFGIEYSVSYAGEPVFSRWKLPRAEDGSAVLSVGGAAVRLRPEAQRGSIGAEVLGQFRQATPAAARGAAPMTPND